jgi:DNA-binding XRE family transcriptional regulator
MNIMQANNSLLTSIDDIMDAKYGKEGTPERESFRNEAYAFYMGQIIHDARKAEKVTQQELASRIGANKSYISKIENGDIEPGIGTFYRIIEALGLRFDIVKPVY